MVFCSNPLSAGAEKRSCSTGSVCPHPVPYTTARGTETVPHVLIVSFSLNGRPRHVGWSRGPARALPHMWFLRPGFRFRPVTRLEAQLRPAHTVHCMHMEALGTGPGSRCMSVFVHVCLNGRGLRPVLHMASSLPLLQHSLLGKASRVRRWRLCLVNQQHPALQLTVWGKHAWAPAVLFQAHGMLFTDGTTHKATLSAPSASSARGVECTTTHNCLLREGWAL